MHPTRRDILGGGAAALTGLQLNGFGHTGSTKSHPTQGVHADGRRPTMLILGGTRFVGPALVESARAHGYEVTLFNRGRSAPEMFADLEQLRGDRDPDVDLGLQALEGDRRWDCVVDTSSYVPRLARAAAKLLAGRVDRYVLISSVSVYADNAAKGLDESGEVGRLDDPTTEQVTGESYGPLKVLCEEAVAEVLPRQLLTLRPGLIVGPGDTSGRFGYYPVRVREGGRMLAPGAPTDPVQFIDVRDLAEFTLHAIATDLTGTYNTVGPTYGCTIGNLLHGCRALGTVGTTFEWISAEKLAEQGLGQRRRIPMWSDPAGPLAKFNHLSGAKAIAAGLTSRALAETVRDYLAWYDQQSDEDRKRYRGGLAPDAERALLEN